MQQVKWGAFKYFLDIAKCESRLCLSMILYRRCVSNKNDIVIVKISITF